MHSHTNMYAKTVAKHSTLKIKIIKKMRGIDRIINRMKDYAII